MLFVPLVGYYAYARRFTNRWGDKILIISEINNVGSRVLSLFFSEWVSVAVPFEPGNEISACVKLVNYCPVT